MSATPKKILGRIKRKKRIRKKVLGTAERPRLSVYRSNKHIYVQVIDDGSGRTLASASTLSPELKGQIDDLKKLDQAKKVGELAAKKCIDGGIDKVVFDRNGYIYTGRVAAVASAARETGLKF